MEKLANLVLVGCAPSRGIYLCDRPSRDYPATISHNIFFSVGAYDPSASISGPPVKNIIFPPGEPKDD